MPNDPLLKLDETDIESLQMFWEDKDKIEAFCSLINVMELFYKKGYLGHYYLLTELRGAIKSNVGIIKRHLGLETDAIVEILATIDNIARNIVEDEKEEDFNTLSEIAANAISTRIRNILRRYPSEVVFALGYSISTPRTVRNTVPFAKRLRFED